MGMVFYVAGGLSGTTDGGPSVGGVSVGYTWDVVVVPVLQDIRDLRHRGYQVGGTFYPATKGVRFNYFSTPDPDTTYHGFAVGPGVGMGFSFHVQSTYSLVVTLGDVGRWLTQHLRMQQGDLIPIHDPQPWE
jgi:hypothetical protein